MDMSEGGAVTVCAFGVQQRTSGGLLCAPSQFALLPETGDPPLDWPPESLR